MKKQVRTMLCVVAAALLSGAVLGCGVTSEVATTHPSTRLAASTVPRPTAAAASDSVHNGRPRPARPGEGSPSSARVAVRPAAGASLARSPKETAEASAIALGSPTRRIQSGRIVDEAGQPLVGATVLLQGTTRGASTDANGDYSLPVPLGTNTFVFAYSGYEPEVAQSRDGQPLVVTLLPAAPDHAATPPEPPRKPRLRKKR